MPKQFRPVVARALIVVCCVAPATAAVTPASALPRIAAASRVSAPPRPTVRVVHRAGMTAMAVIPKPSGCTVSGSQAFIGIPGQNNVAGGLAGVVAGSQNQACDSDAIVGSGQLNVIGGDGESPSAAIVGGAINQLEDAGYGFIGGGVGNAIGGTAPYGTALYSVIVGGIQNTIGSPGDFVGAGFSNTIVANTLNFNGDQIQASFVGAGLNNTVSGNSAAIVAGISNAVAADYATVIGGVSNSVGLNAAYGVVSGGQSNTLSGEFAAIAGGSTNTAAGQYAAVGGGFGSSASGEYAVVPGGHQNVASGESAAVGGGLQNVASGQRATIPGGQANAASGLNSFAAGTSSNAATTGSFVWSDDATGATAVKATVANEFMARASGGFYLYSSANLKSGVKLAPGSGSWSTLSDRTVKTDIVDVDAGRILAKVAALPISEWSYSAEGTGVRHLGPMAQDFYAAFGLGEDDRHIATVDEEGIALAAIKALQAELSVKDRQLTDLKAKVAQLPDLDAKIARLEQRLDVIERTPRPVSAQ